MGYTLGEIEGSEMDIVKASVPGPKGTPYEGGVFTFDICLEGRDMPPEVVYL